MAKDPLDEMVKDLVVFKHENASSPEEKYFSNNPLWADSRVREHWLKYHSDEAHQTDESDEDEGEEEVEVPDYESWTNDDLRTELSSRGLSVDGKKADLVARLIEDDDKNAE